MGTDQEMTGAAGKSRGKTLDLKVGFTCNNNCKHCVVGDRRERFRDRTTAEIKGIMDWGQDMAGRLVLTGGEPTIRKDFIELAAYASRLGYTINIQTNGRMFSYKNFTRELIAAVGKNITVVIAILSSIRECHNYMTSSNSFDQSLGGAANLLECGLNELVINTVVTKSNYRTFPEHAALMAKIGAHAVQYAFVHVLGNAMENISSVMPRKTLVAPYVKAALNILAQAGLSARCEAMTYCTLRGFEQHISEPSIPDTVVMDMGVSILDFTKIRREEEKLKGEDCGKCRHYNVCEGPWRQYPERFGWSEFVPVP